MKDVEVQLFNGDCLQIMPELPDSCVDMVLCDLPYGKTRNKWDSVIDLNLLWAQYLRLVKPNGAICLFADGMFMANLMRSRPDIWRYNLVWDKILPSGFLNANKMPLRSTEEILVFYKKLPTYNPQKIKGAKNHSKGGAVGKISGVNGPKNHNYGDYMTVENTDSLKYPTSILHFQKPHPSKSVHPTQKPVELLEYLIHTYTNDGEIVLDNAMGSGSTGVACVNTGRNFIGIELNPQYFKIAESRIYLAKKEEE